MFYSHTFLARKGPLGTVWCAAHLQHRLKKSHYTSTDIGSTVERIMFPEVPIALRMSGHLLLGVVRIYSKKVDYLYQDYNFFLISIRKAFATVEVNLPEDATHAPIHSVTLPDTFELDALDLDDDFYNMGNQDKNLKSLEDITLSCDQIPTGKDPYITICFDENLLSSLHSDDTSGLGARPMEEDAPPVAAGPTTGTRDPSPGYQAGAGERPIEDSLPEDNPEIEVWRDAVHVDNIPLFPDPGNDVMEPDKELELQIMNEKASLTTVAGNDVTEPDRDLDQQTMNAKELLTPVPEEILNPGERSIPPPVSDCALDVLGSNISSGHASPNLAIRSTPPIDKPKARPRKRKHLYDESTVLTNKFMKAALNNYTDIRRKRKCCPSSDLDVWKSNNRLRKEKIFDAPLITGMSTNLCNIYKQDFISSKPHLVMEEFFPEPSVAQSPPMHEARFVPSPQVHDPMSDIHTEIERQRNYEGPVGSSIMREIMGSPNQFTSDSRFTSPSMRDDFTPALASSLGSESQLQMGTTIGTTSTGTLGSEMETPMTFLKEPLGLENTGLSDIPEVMDSAEADDLNFLASEDYTPSKFQRTEGFSSLSGTTRKVAQYLKVKYSVSPISEDLSGDLSFNKLLEGKTRKVCARMFFETLVLKCCELVDVEQEEPYGDINLKLTPLFFKDQV